MDEHVAIGILCGYIKGYISEFCIGADDEAAVRLETLKAFETLGIDREKVMEHLK